MLEGKNESVQKEDKMSREGRKIRELLAVRIATDKMLGIGKNSIKTENYDTFIEMVDRAMTVTNYSDDQFDVGIADDRSMCYVKLNVKALKFNRRESAGIEASNGLTYLIDSADQVDIMPNKDGTIDMLFVLEDVVRNKED